MTIKDLIFRKGGIELKKLLLGLCFMLGLSLWAACDNSDTYYIFKAYTKISTAEVNANFERFTGDFLPRNSNGTRENNLYDLGSSSYKWDDLSMTGDITSDAFRITSGDLTLTDGIHMVGDITADSFRITSGDMTLVDGIHMAGDITSAAFDITSGDLTLSDGIHMTGDITSAAFRVNAGAATLTSVTVGNIGAGYAVATGADGIMESSGVSTTELAMLAGETNLLTSTIEVDHNGLASLQGGDGASEYYHFNAANHTELGDLCDQFAIADYNLTTTGEITAGTFVGVGVGLTNVTADAIKTDNAVGTDKFLKWSGTGLEWAVPPGLTSEANATDGVTIGLNAESSIEVKDNGITTDKILDGTILAADLATDIGIETTGNVTAAAFTGNIAGNVVGDVTGALTGNADTATYATLAGESSQAAYATLAGTASTAAYATLAGSATSAATATYATLSGTATSAASTNYATLSGSATTAATASYATLSGTSSSCAGNAAGLTSTANINTSGNFQVTGVGTFATTGLRVTAPLQTTGTVTMSGSSMYVTSPATFSGSTTISGASVLSSITSGNITGVISGDAACIMFCLPSDAYVATNIDKIMIGRRFNATSVQVSVETAPLGTMISFEVTKNGTSIFSAAKPKITSGGVTNTATCDSTFAVGDRIGWSITQIGSLEAGGDPVYLTIIGVKK